ncbi:hypothetical protein BD310DRAFT_938314 [Dichomitus squalens]|uniref:Uncharacterized protein n=1 Tax=Dichomitus squalens TaxID=114155 RepID=A0A4V2K6S1_9APHY|nr:hypothetical protein BD310DRAFT_938314 [Dichomitus squalens]
MVSTSFSLSLHSSFIVTLPRLDTAFPSQVISWLRAISASRILLPLKLSLQCRGRSLEAQVHCQSYVWDRRHRAVPHSPPSKTSRTAQISCSTSVHFNSYTLTAQTVHFVHACGLPYAHLIYAPQDS